MTLNFNYSNGNQVKLGETLIDELISLYGVQTKLIKPKMIKQDRIFMDYSHLKATNKDVFDIMVLPYDSSDWNTASYNMNSFGFLNVSNIELYISKSQFQSIPGWNVKEGLTGCILVFPNSKRMEITDCVFVTPGINNLFLYSNEKSVWKLTCVPYAEQLHSQIEIRGSEIIDTVKVDFSFDKVTGEPYGKEPGRQGLKNFLNDTCAVTIGTEKIGGAPGCLNGFHKVEKPSGPSDDTDDNSNNKGSDENPATSLSYVDFSAVTLPGAKTKHETDADRLARLKKAIERELQKILGIQPAENEHTKLTTIINSLPKALPISNINKVLEVNPNITLWEIQQMLNLKENPPKITLSDKFYSKPQKPDNTLPYDPEAVKCTSEEIYDEPLKFEFDEVDNFEDVGNKAKNAQLDMFDHVRDERAKVSNVDKDVSTVHLRPGQEDDLKVGRPLIDRTEDAVWGQYV